MREKIFRDLKSEKIIKVHDKKIGLEGFLVIDSRINKRSCGGLRISSSVCKEEIQLLARSMTLKQASFGIERGGAKAGIKAPEDLEKEKKEVLIRRFAEIIKQYLKDRNYLSGPDIGSDPGLINLMYTHIGEKMPKKTTGSPNSGLFTAMSVITGIETSLKIRKIHKKDFTCAIEGFGSVGSSLALMLYKKGAKIVAISTKEGAIYKKEGLDIKEIIRFKKRMGNSWIKSYKSAKNIRKNHLLELEVDVLSPCALDSSINRKNMKKIKSKIICAGANNPVTLYADDYLFKKDILYFPDFITNAGGILGNAMEFVGLRKKEIEKIINSSLKKRLIRIWRLSNKNNISPRGLCILIAERNLKKIKKDNKRSIRNYFVRLGLGLYRQGIIPKFLIRPYAKIYFRNLINK